MENYKLFIYFFNVYCLLSMKLVCDNTPVFVVWAWYANIVSPKTFHTEEDTIIFQFLLNLSTYLKIFYQKYVSLGW